MGIILKEYTVPKLDFFDDIVEQLRGEFIVSTLECLDTTDDLIRAMIEDRSAGASLAQFLNHIHSIKGQGGIFGFGTVTTIAHKLEYYVATMPKQSQKQMKDIQCFVDAIRGIIVNGIEPDDIERKKIFNTLPISNKNIIRASSESTDRRRLLI